MHPLLKALDLPNKPRRKLARMTESGSAEDDTPIACFQCPRCEWNIRWRISTLTECRRGIPCPRCNAPLLEMRPLFVPLKRAHYAAFADGNKSEEFRRYGKRWNEKTCLIGRPVTLSMGYGTASRLTGRIIGFRKSKAPCLLPEWRSIYGDELVTVACIEIHLDQ